MSQGSHSNYFVHTLLRARDWQHRPQFDEVCNWWREGGRGVCALVGMGGAGKTAIADRFLNALLDNTSSTRQRLNPPHSVFVYSFYDDDKPENFFRYLQIWLEGDSAPEKQKSPTQLMFDIQQHQGLIILDGLERVQESGARGGFGRLTSPSLRDLLNHIASGSAAELSVLVTSRFPLTDLRDSQPRFFHKIPIDQIEPEAGIALLRERGVRGSDVQLAPIVEHCGRHALTIDLAGGFIKQYGNADPSTPLNLGTAEELQAEAEQELDDDKRAVLKQGIRFTRIAQRYREAMQGSDEAALALLERICLFRLGVDCETLAAIFTGPAAEKVSGKALASLDTVQLKKKLDWLARMRIIERSKSSPWQTENPQRRTRYSIHPAIRDGVLQQFGREVAKVSRCAILTGLEKTLEHQQASDHLLTEDGENLLTEDGQRIELESQPGRQYPSDHVALDLLEEIVHHTIESGHVDNAWQIYESRLGGLDHLGWRLGDFSRGKRVCLQFSSVALDKFLDWSDQTSLLYDLAFYLRETGDLAGASYALEICIRHAKDSDDAYPQTFGRFDLARTRWLRGMIKDAHAVLRPTFRLPCENLALVWSHSCLYAARGYLRFLRGAIGEACHDFHESLRLQQEHDDADRKESLYGEQAVWASVMTLHLGRSREVNDVCNSNLRVKRAHCGTDSSLFAPLCYLVLADRHVIQGNLRHGVETLAVARNWALERDDKELLCWSSLVRSHIQLSVIKNRDASSIGEEENQCMHAANASITEGLKIARDCGYGLYHIDLLLERARLHLLRGDAGAALRDIEIALDTGIPANEETGQVELLAANHEECGYAWPIPFGLQLRAEALLLKAAQSLKRDSFLPAKISELPAEMLELIEQSKQLLNESLDLWQPLHDPEPERDDQNFKLDGKEYNYRAADTHQLFVELQAGLLTRYPLEMKENPMNERGLGYGDGADDEDKSPPKYSETVNVEPVAGKLKILFLAANPEGTTRLKLAEEFRNIQDRIRECKFRDRMELTIRQAVRHSDLALALMEERPHIVHFSGHGSDRDELILQDQQGNPHPVSRNALVALVKTLKDDIRLIVFNACYSKPQSEGIVENIAFAIGMKQAIGDKAAIQFAESLYQGIGFGRTLKEAFDLGTIALQLAGIGEELTPQLLNHPKANPEITKLIDVDQQQAAQQKVENNTMSKYSGAVDLWQEKLKRLQEALATEDDVTRKLRYEKQIEECNQKIQELTANPQ